MKTLTEAEAAEIAARHYGLHGSAKIMPSEVDETFRIETGTGRFVLKVSGPEEGIDRVAFQVAVLRHLEGGEMSASVPRVIADLTGAHLPEIATTGGLRTARLYSFLDGTPWSSAEASDALLREIGLSLARLDRSLASFAGPCPQIDLIWDLGNAGRVRSLAGATDDLAERALVIDALDEVAEQLSTRGRELPQHVIHNDFNPSNVLIAEGSAARVAGVIDFGDIVLAPRINDLAIALAYQLGRAEGLDGALRLYGGYSTLIDVTEAEQDLLPVLVRGRLAMTIAITTWRAQQSPERADYVLRNRPAALSGLNMIGAMPNGAWAYVFRKDNS